MLREQPAKLALGLTRRQLATSAATLAGVGVAARLAPQALAAEAQSQQDAGHPPVKRGATILFQGDSITDAGRARDAAGEPNAQAALGNGYAWLAAAQMLVDRPHDELKIFNRGISGNKVHQLAERWQADCLEIKPDVLSVLIGVNDFWHTLNGDYDGTLQRYESDYLSLLKRTRETLPDVRLIVCEPFVLRCGAVGDKWFPEFDEYRAAARRVASEFNATFVPFQAMFDEAAKIAPPERWARDGVHPSPDGAAMMAHLWRRTVDSSS